MKRLVLAILTFLAVSPAARPAETGQLDASPSLFTVMAAINAAGYSAELSSPTNHPLRAAIRAELAKRNIPSLSALKDFFDRHRQKNDTLELSQYISFALSCVGPPTFAFTQRDVEIPPEVVGMRELSGLLEKFYQEANVEDLWRRSQPAIEQYLGRYHEPVTDAVLQVSGYLRQSASGFKGRRFQIFIELLAGPNQIQTRSYGFNYTVVVTPSPEPRIFDLRHAYLHYLLDPLATRNMEILTRKKSLMDHVIRAQGLGDSYKEDFLLLTSESLIKAVEARLDHKPSMVQDALKEGYALAPYFAESLPAYEKQETSMVYYFTDMVQAIDLAKEDKRLTGVEFNKTPKERPGRTVITEAPAPPPPTGAAKTLADAEDLLAARTQDPSYVGKAKKLFLGVLEQTDKKPMHAAAYYGLARVAALEKDPETADRLFKKTLELEPEAAVKAWALVYLGKLSQAAGEREQALQYFQDALKVEGASKTALTQAQAGVAQSSKK
ncbi:MAG TPA: tetratricopeptide repeat protein [Candidatus Acidoferrales bacterium]|nr:tetratricopeptide repeat protein [Candidatus Acidoferrales bacterium]